MQSMSFLLVVVLLQLVLSTSNTDMNDSIIKTDKNIDAYVVIKDDAPEGTLEAEGTIVRLQQQIVILTQERDQYLSTNIARRRLEILECPTLNAKVAMTVLSASCTLSNDVVFGTGEWADRGITYKITKDPIMMEELIIDRQATISNTGQIFRVLDGATLIMEGVTLTGSYGDTGGMVKIQGNSKATFIDCIIRNNVAGRGAVAYVYAGGEIVFLNCLMIGNTAYSYGATIFTQGDAKSVTIINPQQGSQTDPISGDLSKLVTCLNEPDPTIACADSAARTCVSAAPLIGNICSYGALIESFSINAKLTPVGLALYSATTGTITLTINGAALTNTTEVKIGSKVTCIIKGTPTNNQVNCTTMQLV